MKNPCRTKDSQRERSETETEKKYWERYPSRGMVVVVVVEKRSRESSQMRRIATPVASQRSAAWPACSGSVSPPPWETGTAGHWAQRPASSTQIHTKHTHTEAKLQAWGLVRVELKQVLCVNVHVGGTQLNTVGETLYFLAFYLFTRKFFVCHKKRWIPTKLFTTKLPQSAITVKHTQFSKQEILLVIL